MKVIRRGARVHKELGKGEAIIAPHNHGGNFARIYVEGADGKLLEVELSHEEVAKLAASISD